MYPSRKDAVYGTFVANFVEQMNRFNKNGITDKIVLRGRDGGKLRKIYKYIRFYLAISYMLSFHRYDLIYVHTISYTILPIKWVSKWKKLPLIFNVHGGDVLTRSALAAKLKRQAKPIVEQAKMIVSPSHFFKQILLQEFSGLNTNQIFVSPSGGVDKSFFTTSHRQENDVFTIGYVSRISEAKGWDTLLNAIHKLTNEGVACKLIVAGRGKQPKEFRTMIENLKLTKVVNYLGPVPYSYLPNVYQKMDLFVFPTCLEESLGLVGLEAMATRTPIIGSRIGGLTDYITDGENGFFFTPGDTDDLTRAIRQYMQLSKEEKEQLTNNAYKTALQYESEFVGSELFNKINTNI